MNMENITDLRKKRALNVYIESFKIREDISEVNRKDILDFVDSLCMESLSAARKYFYLCRFPRIVRYAENKELKTLSRKEIEEIIAKIQRDETAAWTKICYKIAIKKFFQWIEHYPVDNIQYPAKVSWIKTRKRTDIKVTSSDIFTVDEISNIISRAKCTRDKALLSVLYESGCRCGELLNLRIKDLEFHDYGVHVSINGTKNVFSQRKVLLIASLPALAKWINENPNKDDPTAFVWISFSSGHFGGCITDSAVRNMVRDCIKRAGVKGRRTNVHNWRHTRASHLAKKLTESQLCNYLGWRQGSDVPSVYVHMNNLDVDEGILEMNGIKLEDDNTPTFMYKICPRCNKKHSQDTKVCECGLVLDERFAQELEKKEKEVINNVITKEALDNAVKDKVRQILEEEGLLGEAIKKNLI